MKHLITLLILIAFCAEISAQEAVDTTNWKALYTAAKGRIAKTDYFTAMNYLQKALQLHESDTLKRELAVCYYNRGYYYECGKICRSILYPDSLESDMVLLTKSLKKTEEFLDMMSYQKIIFKKNPLNQANTIGLAQSYLDFSRPDLAVECLDEYCQLDSTNLSINTMKARALFAGQKYQRAVEEYEKLMLDDGGNTPVNFYYYGVSLRMTGNYLQSVTNLTLANELTEWKNPQILTQLGYSQLKIDSLAYKGAENLKKAVEAMQPDPQSLKSVYYRLADYHEQRNNWRKSLDYYLKIKALDNMDAALSYRISYCYKMLQNADKELEYLDKFLSLSDDSVACVRVKERIQYLKNERFMNGSGNK